jgi:hypothetical protein
LHLTAASAASAAIVGPFFRQLEVLAATDAPMRKAAFVFFPHGTPNTSGFWPGVEGPLDSVKGVLEPLKRHKDRMLIVRGMSSGLEKGYGHQGGNTAALTSRGSNQKEGGMYVPFSTSIDWLIGNHIKQEPLILGQKANSGQRHLISFKVSDAGKEAVKPVNDPKEAFKRVYGREPVAGPCEKSGGLGVPTGGPKPTSSEDVLDVIAADLNALKSDLHSWSRSTLDDQLDAVSDLRTQIKEAEKEGSGTPQMQTSGGTSEGCYAEGTDDFFERSNFMADLIVASFQGGSRRVATFQQGSASGDSFSVPGYGGYHGEVHNLSNGKVGDLTRVTNMQTDLFRDIGYFVDRLADTKDMSGKSLLDTTVVYICTEFSTYSEDSDPHNTGGGMVVNLIGADDYFQTTGQAKAGYKGAVGGVLRHVAAYMGLDVGNGLSANDIGKFPPLDGIKK